MGDNHRKIWWLVALLLVIIAGLLFFLFKNRANNISLIEQMTSDESLLASLPSEEDLATVADEEPDVLRYEAKGANPINSADLVLSPQGAQTRNNILPGSELAPLATAPLDEKDISVEAIRLKMSDDGFEPTSFSVNAKEPVTLAVTSADNSNHVFMFDSPSLMAINIRLQAGETRAITFNAPATPGEYSFHCDVPGHAQSGELGRMIVK